jgi:hypothetical protein
MLSSIENPSLDPARSRTQPVAASLLPSQCSYDAVTWHVLLARLRGFAHASKLARRVVGG